ncbi:MFS transporter [Thiomicrorhabdus indica]|uniref:MFS transporter n=1 Tax=Thiomicrorhabdus indica TaxID=2267253 RepID=UPI002AA62CF9|nr:MFS transporter [Thiomicrorhabdus indica]
MFSPSLWRCSSCSFPTLFFVQFLGAFNDNLFKNALVVWFTFKLATNESDGGLLVTLAAGLFILPFVLFSAFAGRLADTYDKIALIKKIKLAEIGIMGLGALALVSQSVELMLISLFFMGVQSAFFGPIKYSILPQLLTGRLLIKANGWFSGSTFIAILLGTIFGGLGIMLPAGETWMAVAVIATAVLGWLASLGLKTDLPVTKMQSQTFRQMVAQAKQVPIAFKSVLAISWFWFFGAVILSQIPTLVKFQVGGNDSVVVLFLTLFSVGIAVGSGLIAKLMPPKIHLNWHSFLLVGMGLSLAVGMVLLGQLPPAGENLLSVHELISNGFFQGLLLSFAAMALFGGAYIVPLYTLIQIETPEPQRARMIALNNIINSLLMVLSALLIMLGYALGLELLTMLLIVALMNLPVVFWLKSLGRDLSG